MHLVFNISVQTKTAVLRILWVEHRGLFWRTDKLCKSNKDSSIYMVHSVVDDDDDELGTSPFLHGDVGSDRS